MSSARVTDLTARERDTQSVGCEIDDPSSTAGSRRLTAVEFQGLADIPPEAEWFANIDSPQTRRAYRKDLREFMAFVGISAAGEFRIVIRSHIITWRKDLEARGSRHAESQRHPSMIVEKCGPRTHQCSR